ncbi:hypothetical protein HDU81_001565, partial [Chytriomyces hyalinus]
PPAAADRFFHALYSTKKKIRDLSVGHDYFNHIATCPASLDLAAKWLVKLPIYELRFQNYSTSIPTQILSVLHLAPILHSLHLHNLGECAQVAFSECKSLQKLTLSHLFAGAVNPEVLVCQLVNVVKDTKIQQLGMSLPWPR